MEGSNNAVGPPGLHSDGGLVHGKMGITKGWPQPLNSAAEIGRLRPAPSEIALGRCIMTRCPYCGSANLSQEVSCLKDGGFLLAELGVEVPKMRMCRDCGRTLGPDAFCAGSRYLEKDTRKEFDGS